MGSVQAPTVRTYRRFRRGSALRCVRGRRLPKHRRLAAGKAPKPLISGTAIAGTTGKPVAYSFELVNLRRRWLPFLPKDSGALGSLTWWILRGTAPICLWALPRILSLLNTPWPRLQNHFFRLCVALR